MRASSHASCTIYVWCERTVRECDVCVGLDCLQADKRTTQSNNSNNNKNLRHLFGLQIFCFRVMEIRSSACSPVLHQNNFVQFVIFFPLLRLLMFDSPFFFWCVAGCTKWNRLSGDIRLSIMLATNVSRNISDFTMFQWIQRNEIW